MTIDSVYEVLGWIGSIAFAICALPQAWDSYQKGSSKGITWGFFVLWSVGELFTFLYVIPMGHLPMIFNYSLNMIFLSIIGYYKVKPRKKVRVSRKVEKPALRIVK